MIADFLRKILNISSPSKVALEEMGIYADSFFEGFQNGLDRNAQSTEEERMDAWIRMEDISRNVLLLDKFNYEDYPSMHIG